MPAPVRLSPRAVTAGAALLLVLLALLLWWPLLAGERALYFGDLGLYFVPQLAFQRRELLEGRIPLWNPHPLCGTPFAGNPQAWPLYPSSALLYALPAHHAAGAIGVLHVAWAAVGTLLFLRRRGLGGAAAALGALAFAFGGALVSKMQFPNMVQAASFLPWLLWAVEGAIARPAAGRAALLAVAVGLALLAAHPQMFVMQFYLCAAWAIWRIRGLPRRGRQAPLRALLAGAALGGLLAAAQLLPVLDLMRASVRAGITLEKADRFVLPPEMLLTAFVLPDFYGNPARGDYIGRGNFWEPCAYAGLVPFALALGALWKCIRVADVRFWAGTGLVALWLSLGKIGGLYVLAFYGLPGVSKFHDPARWLHVAAFGLACLAASGLNALLAPLAPRRRALLAGAALGFTALDLLPFTRALNPSVDARVFAAPPPSVQSLRARGAQRLFHADNDLVWGRFVTHRSYLPGGPAQVQAFLGSLAPNLPALYGLSGADGYEPVRRTEADRLLRLLRTGADEKKTGKPSPLLAPLLREAGIDTVVSLRPGGVPGLGPPEKIGSVLLQTVPGAVPRAALWSVGSDAPPLPAVIERDEPDRVVVAVPAGAGGRLLVLLDSWHPGWRARIDDGPARPVARVNASFRGVPLGPRTRRVEFRYMPASWTVGLYFSLLGSGILAGTTAFHLLSRDGVRRSRGESEWRI